MLKKFLLNTLSAFVGSWLAIGLVALSVIMLCIGLTANLAKNAVSQTNQVKSRSILVLDLDGPIEERESALEPDIQTVLAGGLEAPMTLDVLVQSIREAAENDDIVAIYLKCGSVEASGATLNALRQELMAFRKSVRGAKKILAYGDSYSQGGYFIATAADSIFMNPQGELSLRGLGSTIPYMKGLFEKLGVEFQVVKVGTYKSAVEPYILEQMSAPARAQMDTLLGNMWSYMRGAIAERRKGITPAGIDSLISKAFISMASSGEAVKCGLIDKVVYESRMDSIMSDISGREIKKLNYVEPSTLASQTDWGMAYSSKNQIAVLYACGEIADGNNNQINYETLVPVINRLAADEKVKGMVLRVNSPGGSVFGSDQIGNALDNFQAKGKPLAVSMGDYAASGGYWISAHADRIFADPLTITGSIGIFGLLPNVKGTLDKLGVNMETVATNPQALFPSISQPMDENQKQVMQSYVDRGYDQFVTRVAIGRKMTKAAVLKIAEGRVWDARTAVKIGLVDKIGSLQDAVEWVAAKTGNTKDYDVAAYPQVEPTFWNMLQLSGITMEELKIAVDTRNEDAVKAYLVRRLLSRKPLQARMPEFKVII